ncbi:MAG: hypothetical protein NT175_08945 [Bacteroidetes bacterium]|nr:hypothetical protein [Bacteroidota bacterium]
MTLVVSLRVPDGVVLAADSLQTAQVAIQPGVKDFKVKNPKTGEEIPFGDLILPPIMMPTSTFSYAQKLFSFQDKFGVATFGSAVINNRTIYNHIKNLELSTKKEVKSVSETGEILMDYFTNQLQEQLKTSGQKLIKGQIVMGFHVVGYETANDLFGHTVDVAIGETPISKMIDGIGCTVSGDTEVVRKIWEIGQGTNRAPNYGSFSLKDAIDYVEFLINTTTNFQRFANMIPTVGGSVDIALITNYSKFTWIKYKDLTKILEKI